MRNAFTQLVSWRDSETANMALGHKTPVKNRVIVAVFILIFSLFALRAGFHSVALLTLIVGASAQEQCVFSAGEWVPYAAARDCFESVPFSDEVRDETVDMLQKGMQLFGFLDISNDSPEPKFPMQVACSFQFIPAIDGGVRVCVHSGQHSRRAFFRVFPPMHFINENHQTHSSI